MVESDDDPAYAPLKQLQAEVIFSFSCPPIHHVNFSPIERLRAAIRLKESKLQWLEWDFTAVKKFTICSRECLSLTGDATLTFFYGD